MDADLPTTRARAARRGLPRSDRREHGAPRPHRRRARRSGTLAVTLDGEALAAPPLEEVALSGRYLLG